MEQATQKIEQTINTAETERQERLNFIITVKNSVLAIMRIIRTNK
jgi:hypothetical protein